MKKLSARQQTILAFIEGFIEENDYPPTIRDIQSGCGISSTSVVSYNLDRLKEGGYLNRASEVSRGLALSSQKQTFGQAEESETVAVPLLGTIARFTVPNAGERHLV